MSRREELIERLPDVIAMESRLAEHYKAAGDSVDDGEIRSLLYGMQESHASYSRRLEQLRDELERKGGEGVLGETLESLGAAFTGVVGTLPASFINAKIEPNPLSLRRFEGDLLRRYEELHSLAGADGGRVIDAAMEHCRTNIERLNQIDPLSELMDAGGEGA